MVAAAAAIASLIGTGVGVAGQLSRNATQQPQQKFAISQSALDQAGSNNQYQRALSALINQRSTAGTQDAFGSTLRYDPATNTWVSDLGQLPKAEQTAASQAEIARNTTDLRQSQLANEMAMRRAALAAPGYDTAVRNLQQFRPQSADELGGLLTGQAVTANNAVMRPMVADMLAQYGRAGSNASVPLANLGRQSYDNLKDALISGRIGALQNTASINNANRQGLESAATTSAGLSNPNLQFSGIQPSQQSAIMANMVADRAKTASTAPAFGASGVNEAQKNLLSGATGAASNVPDPNANINQLTDAGKTLASEWDDRQHRSVQRGLKNANFRYSANIEQLDYSGDRGLDKNLVQRLSGCDFIKKGEDLFITGSTGTGKSFLASAIGQQACLLGYKVLYTNTAKLMSHLKMAKADGAHLKELAKIEKQDALILDDFGVQPFDAGSRALLLDIIEDRHGKRSTIITAQVPVKKWHEVIGEKTLADAILDRIVHQSIRIELYGESLRKKQKGKPEIMESYL